MINLNKTDRQAQIDDMRSFDEQMPSVGIFWHDPNDHTLFGVHKKELTPREVEEAADNGKPFINYPHLHRQIWAKEYLPCTSQALRNKVQG